jgi:preprotein translocase subunit SecD
MRNSFHILLAAVVLLASRGYSATDTKSATLAFYVVSEEKVDGGRFIDTLDLPKLGYIAAKPDLVITQLVAVSETVTHSSMGKIGRDGKVTSTPLPDQPALVVQILPADAQKFESLTEHGIGKRVLMMLGDTPLIAPTINSPISTQSFQISFGEHSNRKVIEDALKKLVH